MTLTTEQFARLMTEAVIKQQIRLIIAHLGDDPEREGLRETPDRVMKAWKELFAGYEQDPKDILKTFSADGYDEVMVVKGIKFTSFCEHHMLQFAGTVAVGYLPADRIVGLSKLARLVECFSKRLQVQERMTVQIAAALQDALAPRGVGCVVKAEHSCMGCRGVKAAGAVTVTSHLTGTFKTDPAARAEFFNLVGG